MPSLVQKAPFLVRKAVRVPPAFALDHPTLQTAITPPEGSLRRHLFGKVQGDIETPTIRRNCLAVISLSDVNLVAGQPANRQREEAWMKAARNVAQDMDMLSR